MAASSASIASSSDWWAGCSCVLHQPGVWGVVGRIFDNTQLKKGKQFSLRGEKSGMIFFLGGNKWKHTKEVSSEEMKGSSWHSGPTWEEQHTIEMNWSMKKTIHFIYIHVNIYIYKICVYINIHIIQMSKSGVCAFVQFGRLEADKKRKNILWNGNNYTSISVGFVSMFVLHTLSRLGVDEVYCSKDFVWRLFTTKISLMVKGIWTQYQ